MVLPVILTWCFRGAFIVVYALPWRYMRVHAPMVPLWDFDGGACASIGSMVVPWGFYGASMVFGWCFYGAAMGLPWCSYGKSTALPWWRVCLHGLHSASIVIP